MKKVITAIYVLAVLVIAGCVERKLTINTEPQGGVVYLNDEEIGTAPVTVAFEWYGDYAVRVEKNGYETLDTHKKLDAPLLDHFPFDFFAESLWPGKIVNSYEWTFDLKEYQQPERQTLLDASENLRKETEYELK